MKKRSLGKKLLLTGSILTLAVACQSKPVRQPVSPAQPLNIDTEEQGEDEDEESSWDQTEPFQIEEKQMKSVSAPAPVEPVKPEIPKTAIVVPVEPQLVPADETKSAPAAAAAETLSPAVSVTPAAEVQTSVVPVPAAAVIETVPSAASESPVAETAAPAEKPTITQNATENALLEKMAP